MSLPFREVISRAESALAPFLTADRKLTLLRDVQGKVRVVAEGISAPVSQPDALAMEQALRAAIGDWLGDRTPVWALRKKRDKLTDSERLILNEIERSELKLPSGLFLVERHVSRAAWTGDCPYDPPWPLQSALDGVDPPIITFFSHKGGVGRSTALAATGLLLARGGHKVVLVDFDLEAPGLDSLFGAEAQPDEGVLDLLVAPTLEEGALEVTGFFLRNPDLVGEGGELRVLTAGKVDDGYLEMLARLDVDAGSNRDSLLHRLRALFTLVRDTWSPDFILVDARAGFHDLGGLMLASLTHVAVMVLTANPQSEHGLKRVSRLLSARYRAGGEPPVPLVLAHGMSPELGTGGDSERLALRERAHDVLVSSYYPPGLAPGLLDQHQPHAPVPLPWIGALRGKGGHLSPEVATLLRGEPYQELSRRVQAACQR